MATTTYDINVRYQLQDKVSQPMKGMGKEIQKTNRHGRNLVSTMKLVMGAAVLGFGFRAGKKWLIDYNSEMDSARIKMQTLLSLGLNKSFMSQQQQAADLVKQMTKDAAVGVGTTKDYILFAGEITKPLLDAGASMQDLTDITRLGVTAAKAFGIEGDVAGRDIQQMLMGNLRNVDRLPKLLGVNAKAWNEMFRSKGPEEALKQLKAVLDTKQMNDAAKAYGQSWEGVTSTLEDNLQRTLGEVGLPLMKLLSAEIKKMNSYFEENPEKVKEFIKTLSEGLVRTFGYIKSVVEFIVKNSGTLMALAKAYIGFKVISGVGGMIGGLGSRAAMAGFAAKEASLAGNVLLGFSDKVRLAGGGMGGLFKVVKHATGGIGGLGAAAVQLVGKFNLTMMGLAAVYAGARLLADKVDQVQTKKMDAIAGRAQGFLSAAAGDSQGDPLSDAKVLAYAMTEGFVTEGDRVAQGRFTYGMRGRKGSKSQEAIDADIARQTGVYGRGHTGFRGTFAFKVGDDQIYDKRTLTALDRLEGILSRKREEDSKAFRENIKLMGRSFLQFMKQGGNMKLWNRQAGFDQSGVLSRGFNMMDPSSMMPAAPSNANKSIKKNGDVIVHINTIRVTTSDPDRFAMQLTGAFRNINNKPIASRMRVPGGRRR